MARRNITTPAHPTSLDGVPAIARGAGLAAPGTFSLDAAASDFTGLLSVTPNVDTVADAEIVVITFNTPFKLSDPPRLFFGAGNDNGAIGGRAAGLYATVVDNGGETPTLAVGVSIRSKLVLSAATLYQFTYGVLS